MTLEKLVAMQHSQMSILLNFKEISLHIVRVISLLYIILYYYIFILKNIFFGAFFSILFMSVMIFKRIYRTALRSKLQIDVI